MIDDYPVAEVQTQRDDFMAGQGNNREALFLDCKLSLTSVGEEEEVQGIERTTKTYKP